MSSIASFAGRCVSPDGLSALVMGHDLYIPFSLTMNIHTTEFAVASKYHLRPRGAGAQPLDDEVPPDTGTEFTEPNLPIVGAGNDEPRLTRVLQ